MPSGPMDQPSNEPKPKTEVCLALLHTRPAHANSLGPQADEMLEKIYSNMSACHIKNGNWKRAVETADKVRPALLAL